jgi:hypothetical protein
VLWQGGDTHTHSPSTAILRCGHSAIDVIAPDVHTPSFQVEVSPMENTGFPDSEGNYGEFDTMLSNDAFWTHIAVVSA